MDDKAESPLEAVFVFMAYLFIAAILLLTLGTLTDSFVDVFGKIRITLDAHHQGLFGTPMKLFSWVFIVPVFFAGVMLVWMFKTIIKKHKYTRQQELYEEGW